MEKAETTAAMRTEVSYGNAGEYIACPSIYRKNAFLADDIGDSEQARLWIFGGRVEYGSVSEPLHETETGGTNRNHSCHEN